MVFNLTQARAIDNLRKLGLYETLCFQSTDETMRWTLEGDHLWGHVTFSFSEPTTVFDTIPEVTKMPMLITANKK